MKIACLQFAPQVGDVDNNLNRADAILNKAKASDLEGLNLLVLPELAFSGYNFKSLQHIAPYLEPPGSGISSLWARTTALKYDCSVIVGYPEKVDVSVKWPASPEYYNSALVVNGDGDTIANYRKCFLYFTDETWALEGRDGFFRGEIPRVGEVAMGICMDLNPYKFEAEWDAFEFGFHALDSEANVVILTMAWTTEQDPRIFSRRPQDPDLETLVYWVQRLEPLIRADREGEVIVVVCNRCGSEDDVTYAGTSAVLGILQGEVYVYGVLGRGVKDLLVVDTDNLPPSKLTDAASMDAQRKSYDAEVAEYLELDEDLAEEFEDQDQDQDPEPEPISRPESQKQEISAAQQPEPEDDDCAIISDEEDDDNDGDDYLSPLPSSAISPQQSHPPLFTGTGRMSSLRNQLRLVIPSAPAISDPTPIEIDSAIPYTAIDEDDDIIIDSPGASPVLPKLNVVIPASPWRFRKKPSPYPWQLADGQGPQPQVFGGGKVCMTPITPFDTGSPIVWAKSGPMSAAWRPAQAVSSLVSEAIPEDEVVQDVTEVKGKKPSSGHSSRRTSRQASREREYNGIVELNSPEKLRYRESKQSAAVQVSQPQVDDREVAALQGETENNTVKEETADHPSEPEGEKEPEEQEQEEEGDESPIPDLSAISAILDRLRLAEGYTPAAPSSHTSAPPLPPLPPPYEASPSPCPDRPYSPKSLNASRNQSRSRLLQLRDEHAHIRDPTSDERITSISRGTIPISASPSVFDTESYYYRPQSIPISASPSLFSSVNTDTLNSPVVALDPVGLGRPVSRMAHRHEGSKSRAAVRSLSLPAVNETQTQPRSASLAGTGTGYNGTNGGGRHERRRSSLRITTSNLDEQPARVVSREASREGSNRQARSSSRRRAGSASSKSGKRHRRRRPVSRGRQPGTRGRGTSVDRSDSVGESRSQVSLSRRRQSLQRESRPDSEVPLMEIAMPSSELELEANLNRRTRTVSGSGRSSTGRRRRSVPAPLLLGDASAHTPALEKNSTMPDDNGGDTDIEIDTDINNDTEIEADVNPSGGSDNEDVLIGTVKRIAPDCPHHSPFRRTFRHATGRHRPSSSSQSRHDHHHQDEVPPPPPLPPASLATMPASTSTASGYGASSSASSSLLSYAVSQSASAISAAAGRWTPGTTGFLSASSAEGGFSSTFSEATCSPMSPDPETPRFFGGGGGLVAVVSGSTVTSPTGMYSEQMQSQMQSQSPVEMGTAKDQSDGHVPAPIPAPAPVVCEVVNESVEGKDGAEAIDAIAGKDSIEVKDGTVVDDKHGSRDEVEVGEGKNGEVDKAEGVSLNPTEESRDEEMSPHLDLTAKGMNEDVERGNNQAAPEGDVMVNLGDGSVSSLGTDINVAREAEAVSQLVVNQG